MGLGRCPLRFLIVVRVCGGQKTGRRRRCVKRPVHDIGIGRKVKLAAGYKQMKGESGCYALARSLVDTEEERVGKVPALAVEVLRTIQKGQGAKAMCPARK